MKNVFGYFNEDGEFVSHAEQQIAIEAAREYSADMQQDVDVFEKLGTMKYNKPSFDPV